MTGAPDRDAYRAGASIEYLDRSHANEIADIHAQCFADCWNGESLAGLLSRDGALVFGAYPVDQPGLAGYLIAQTVLDEAEILSLGVLPSLRRQGLALQLMDAAIIQMRANKIIDIVLDVAVDNPAAIGLYEHFGFRKEGTRRNYYRLMRDTPVDALVMRLTL